MYFRKIISFLLFCLLINISLADQFDENDLETDLQDEEEVPIETPENLRNCEKITQKDIEETFKNCEETLRERRDLEVKLAKKGRIVKTSNRKSDPSLIRRRKADPAYHEREACQLPFDEASNELSKKFKLSRKEINEDLPNLSVNGPVSKPNKDNCTHMVNTRDCDANSRYRTADGQCNNLQNPHWGSTLACQRRILQAFYNGNSGFRLSTNGSPLPAPRTLSLNLHYHLNRPTNYVTHMYMFFGQLLDHDITLTPPSVTVDNEAIECCPPEAQTHPQCEPILVANNDPFYSQFGVTCLNFVRSVICPTCTMGARQQTNQVTAFIDASFVYGNSDNDTNSVRAMDGTGRLRVQSSSFGDLLPSSSNPQEDQCSFPETNDICFEGGDSRINQHTVLTSLHTIFVREHNRIADGLRQINPRWGEDRIFQETRRILGAIMQIITYKEYLPITLGNDRMSYFNLWTGDNTRYDSSKDPTMLIEFTTAAFRFGHSLVNSVVANSPLNSTNGQRLLRNEFFQPFDLYNGIIGPLLKGTTESPAQFFDRHLVQDVTNFLYRVRGNSTGLDLASTNINRGRDHGIPPYIEMVRYCSEGQIVVRRFRDLVDNNLMGYNQARALQRNYRVVNDIDLWPGILLETPNDNAVVGPTATCILGLQFNKLKFGDRFYVEHVNEAGSFSYQQLRELRRVTLSHIICLNTEVNNLPLNAMIFASRNNPLIECSYVKGINLRYWRE